MAWLKLILEDILNEISVGDAWERFYKDTMSQEDYEKIVNGQTNIDKFV